MSRALGGFGLIAITAGLTLMPLAPEVACVVLVIAMLVGLPILAVDLIGGTRLSRAQWTVLAGSALIALTIVVNITSSDDLIILLALLPIPLSVPLSALLARIDARVGLTDVAVLAAAGLAIGSGIVAYDILVRGMRQGGYLTMNPIHLGDIMLVLAIISVAGALGARRWVRGLLILAPFAALVAVYFTGSRGPLLAFLLLGAATGAWLTINALPQRWRVSALAGSAVAALAVIVSGLLTGWLAAIPGIDQIIGIFGGTGGSVDESTQSRLSFYQGAWQAFLQSPLTGHGGHFVAAADAMVPEDISGWDHLHSDIADFAAIGGALGLLSYLLLLASPIVAGLSARADTRTSGYLGIALSAAFLAMGLTNAVFGILSLTALFSLVVALLFRLDRR
jgi:O-antigen ligase